MSVIGGVLCVKMDMRVIQALAYHVLTVALDWREITGSYNSVNIVVRDRRTKWVRHEIIL